MHRLTPRVIPCLLLKGGTLVKTVKFKDPRYLGDPINAVKIFNEKEVDELILLDITATIEGRGPNFDLVREIVSEAFMPVAYGGGVKSVEDAKRLAAIGVEKIVINTQAVEDPDFIGRAANVLGSSSVVVCIDTKRNILGRPEVFIRSGKVNAHLDPVNHAINVGRLGAGEIVVNSIDRDGVMAGYDIKLLSSISDNVTIPIIACGGAGKIEDFAEAIKKGGASAVAAGSLFVFQGKHRAVLINFPERQQLQDKLL